VCIDADGFCSFHRTFQDRQECIFCRGLNTVPELFPTATFIMFTVC
jgi:hypothetical protein